MKTITTSIGTTVTLKDSEHGSLVVLDHPDAPDDMRNLEAGRLARFSGDWGFQPAMFSEGLIGPETLRAIADLIEAHSG